MPNIPIFKSRKKENKYLPRVYFSCLNEDFDKCFMKITDEIVSKCDCNIYYLENRNYYPSNDEEKEEYLASLKDINLFVFPITFKYLTNDSLSKNIDFNFAKENNYPILPVLVEPGLFDLFNQKLGNIQALDINSLDTGENSFKFKLFKYLDSVFVSGEKAEKIRKAFNAYIFLSYRKKDRKHAQEIMSLIHKNDFMRDVAIWYDENLTPGRDFNDEIKAIMEKSDIVSFVVTPNINEKDNYVLTVEYPAAIDNKKKILPIESVNTDREILSYNFKKFTNIVNKNNADELANKLKELIVREGFKENNDPEHIYFIGLAYLNAIDVERDTNKAIELFETSAIQEYVPSIKELVKIYSSGIGTNIDYRRAILWQEKYLQSFDQNINDDYVIACMELGELLIKIGDYPGAKKLFDSIYEVIINKKNLSALYRLPILNNLAICYLHSKDKNDLNKAISFHKQCYEEFRTMFGEDSVPSLIALDNLCEDYMRLGEHYEEAIENRIKCYEMFCDRFGKSNPNTLICLNNLVTSFMKAGYDDYFHLITKLENNKSDFIKTFGEKHPYTINFLSNLAVCYAKTGNFKDAIEIQKKCVENSIIVLGPDHQDTKINMKNLVMYLNESENKD